MLGLNSHTLNFEIIPSSNKFILLFLDESYYFEKPEKPLLKITAPGNSRYFAVNITEGELNVLNSHLIGYTNVLETDELICLPDGIWQFTYMICPYDYLSESKYHLRTTQLDCQLREIYGSVDIDCEIDSNKSCTKDELVKIHILIESAKANAELGNLNKANKDFSLAQLKVKKLMGSCKRSCHAV